MTTFTTITKENPGGCNPAGGDVIIIKASGNATYIVGFDAAQPPTQ
jgi:hypothetical protein